MSLISYVSHYGDRSFVDEPFNDVDSIILSNIFYCDFHGAFSKLGNPESVPLSLILLSTAKGLNAKKNSLGLLIGSNPIVLADNVRHAKRYSEMTVSDFVEKQNYKKDLQFAAICFHLSPRLIYLLYRGTDDSVSGWLEDLDLLVEKNMPCQSEAVKYLEQMMEKYPYCQFIVAGHSKGGNIAVYASTYCRDEYKSRILKLYSVDGNGFYPGTFDNQRFALLADRALLIAPVHCLVARLFVQPINHQIIVESTKKGLLCHDVNTWMIKGHYFVVADHYSSRSDKVSQQINTFVLGLSLEQREFFYNDFKDAIDKTHIINLLDFKKNPGAAVTIVLNLNLRNQAIILRFSHILIANMFMLN